MLRLSILASVALLAACARSEPADEISNQAQPAGLQPAEVGAGNAVQPTLSGTWEAAAEGPAQAAVFRAADGAVPFTMACDLRGGVVVRRPGLVARGNLALMQLRTETVVRRYAVSATAGPEPQVEARIPYNDPLLATLLSFDDSLEVRYEGLETLTLPPSPVVSDLVRTCQQASGGAEQAPAGNEVAPAEDEAAPAPAAETNSQ
jgi:hypothetical protein